MPELDSLEHVFAPYALRIACGPLTMRVTRDVDVPPMVRAIHEKGIYDPRGVMPFLHPWDQARDDLALNTLQHHYRSMASWSPESWQLHLHVSVERRFVGIQTVEAEHFRETRTAETGSWLLRTEQGRGVGTLMRQAALAFAIDELGAEILTSGAFIGNHASEAVSRKLGYVPNGLVRHLGVDGKGWREETRFRLNAGDLVRAPYPVEVTGADAFRRSIGLDSTREDSTAE